MARPPRRADHLGGGLDIARGASVPRSCPRDPPRERARRVLHPYLPGGFAMPHLLDPPHLDTEAAYLAALDELEALMAEDPDTPAGHRCDELLALIEAYEAREPPEPAPPSAS
jgi:hypothetical protein